jgi:hypothetical protein
LKKAKVVAAIDFGTYGSGFAWSPISERNKIASARQVITELKWPGAPMPTPKNLSALATRPDGTVEAWGYDARKRWNAAAIRHSAEDISYFHAFKMRLIDEEHAEDAVFTVTAYLGKLVEYATERIKASGYDADDIRWCLTVPAIWTDFQKQVMRKAAEAAGLPAEKDRLIFALEPEAAAHYARVSGLRTSGLSGGRATLMSPKSRFMVVDCGGGTIDITSYRADADNNLEEIGNDCGGPYGSDYLNRAFVAEVLLARFASWTRMRELATDSPAGFASLVEGWEKEKTQVEFPVVGEIYIPMPAALHRILTDSELRTLGEKQDGIADTIVVSEDETAAIFDRIVSKVLELVDKQLGEMQLQRRGNKGDEIIVLVGGFGASKYLQTRLQEHVTNRATVIIPPDPGVAVLEGAVHYAYDPQIIARKTKLTYGIASSREFKVGIDPASKRFEDDMGRVMCSGYFSIFVNAQQIVRAGKCISNSFIPVYGDQTKLSIKIHATKNPKPRYVDEDGVLELGNMVVDLSSVMHKRMQDRSVQVSMFFGETELRVQAVLEGTDEVLQATLELAPQEWE